MELGFSKWRIMEAAPIAAAAPLAAVILSAGANILRVVAIGRQQNS
jgi:hypothetical protein